MATPEGLQRARPDQDNPGRRLAKLRVNAEMARRGWHGYSVQGDTKTVEALPESDLVGDDLYAETAATESERLRNRS